MPVLRSVFLRLPPLLVFVAILLGHAVVAQPYVAGQAYFGRNNYIEYRAGDLPIIITASHGGNLTPSEIPNRTYGTFVTDTNTRELAIACAAEIFARTGRRPHLIISHLARIKLDPNREIVEGAQGNVFAVQAWNEFHGFIVAARDSARADHGFGHLIDLHGHGHDIARLELGYALGATELNLSDAALNAPGYSWMSTLRTLHLSRPGLAFTDLIRGPRSLGDLFNLRGVPAWPSPQFPVIGDAEFFNGGHIVREHSCIHDNDTVHGVQIECHFAGVRDSAASRADFAARFANVLQPYLWDNYGYDLGTLSLARIESPASSVLTRGGPPLTVTIRRTGHLALSSNLAVSYGGTAICGSGGDYTTSATTSVFFPANQSVVTLTLTPAAVGPAFGDKTLTLALAPSSTQTADTAPASLTLGDGLSQTVRIVAPEAVVVESAGAARFRLTRTQSAAPLLVPLAWSGDASAEQDYRDAPASVFFPAGVSTAEVAVPLVDDGRAEPDKTLAVALLPGPGFTFGHPDSATLTLRDDDRPVGLSAWLRGDLAGNLAVDSSGLARHATTLPANAAGTSGPTPLVLPSIGDAPAINFDGVNDTVALPKFTLDPDGAFTLAFFFRLDAGSLVGNQNLAACGTRSVAGSLHLYLATTNAGNGTVALRTNLPGLSANALDVTRTAPDAWQDGAWRHYALSVGADGAARVYIDGVLRRTAFGRTGTLARDELLWLGWRPASGGVAGYMRGALRDVRVYARALPIAEVAALATTRQTFTSWLSSAGLDPSGPAVADLDGDGLSLFLEYALGADPARPAPAPRWRARLLDDRLSLEFLRPAEVGDVTWIIEGADALDSVWTALARRAPSDADWSILRLGATVTEMDSRVIFTDAVSLPAQPRRFIRLSVERTP